MYLTDLIGHIRRTSEPKEKSHADWTNRHILEQMNHEEKRQTVSFQFNNMVRAIIPHGKLGSAGKYYQDNRLKKY